MINIRFFFAGILAAVFSLVLENAILILDKDITKVSLFANSHAFIFLVALIEEALLGGMIWKLVKDLDGRKKILAGSFFSGLGFAFFEIVLYLLKNPSFSALYSYLGLIFIHISTALVFGFYFSFPTKRNYLSALFVFLAAVLAHFLFNFAVLNELSDFL